MIESALLSLLADNDKQADIYIAEIPLDAPLPAAVLVLESSDTRYAQRAPKVVQDQFEVGCYARSPLEAAQLNKALERIIDGFKGEVLGKRITLARCVNRYDYQEKQSNSFARIFTLIVNYLED